MAGLLKNKNMKISELIEKLSSLDPNLEIFVEGYEGGCDDISDSFVIETVLKNVNTKWYYGPHEINKNGDTKGILLKGLNR